MAAFADYRDHVGANHDRFFKTTLFQSAHLLLGLDCLEPGQQQPAHQHAGRDKFYFVIEGHGHFTIADQQADLGPGEVAWAPADAPHAVINTGAVRLVMLIGMAPLPN